MLSAVTIVQRKYSAFQFHTTVYDFLHSPTCWPRSHNLINSISPGIFVLVWLLFHFYLSKVGSSRPDIHHHGNIPFEWFQKGTYTCWMGRNNFSLADFSSIKQVMPSLPGKSFSIFVNGQSFCFKLLLSNKTISSTWICRGFIFFKCNTNWLKYLLLKIFFKFLSIIPTFVQISVPKSISPYYFVSFKNIAGVKIVISLNYIQKYMLMVCYWLQTHSCIKQSINRHSLNKPFLRPYKEVVSKAE